MKSEYRQYATEWAESEALDSWLDNLETLLISLAQRRMTEQQLDRYGRILEHGERDALRRVKPHRAKLTAYDGRLP